MIRLRRPLTPWLPVLFAVAVPLLYVLAVHGAARRLPSDRELVGLLHVDQPAYYACAREPFDAGGGIFYASPYSSRPDAPRIYTHFAFLVIGSLWKLTGAPLYLLDQSLRFLFGAAMLLLAVSTFRRCFPASTPPADPLITAGGVALTIGGGLAWANALWNLLADYVILYLEDPSRLPSLPVWINLYPHTFAFAEGGYGEWGASLMRVLESAPECIYHTLFFSCTLCLAAGRSVLALLFLFLAWWSHPFTGLELGALVCFFLLVESRRSFRPNVFFLAGAVLITGAFLAWYLLWLPRFPEHRSVEAQMRGFGNPMLWGKLLPAYGLFLPLAAAWFPTSDFRRAWREERGVRLMTAWLLVVAGLVFHDRLSFLFRPVQPMHFTRGYLYVPLVYFAVRSLHHWLPVLRARTPRVPAPAVGALLLVVLHLPDNLMALTVISHDLGKEFSPFSVPRESSRVLAQLERYPRPLSLYPVGGADLWGINMYLPVLTRHRNLLPHLFNTPFRKEKEADAHRFSETFRPAYLTRWGIDTLLVKDGELEKIRTRLPNAPTESLADPPGWWLVFLDEGGE